MRGSAFLATTPLSERRWNKRAAGKIIIQIGE